MIIDCINIFKSVIEEKGEDFIFDNWILEDGLYILVDMDNEFKKTSHFILKPREKNKVEDIVCGEDYSFLQKLDYLTQLTSLNKSVLGISSDLKSGKRFFSNQFFSFSTKADFVEKILEEENEMKKKNENKKEEEKKDLPIEKFFNKTGDFLEKEEGLEWESKKDRMVSFVKENLFLLKEDAIKKDPKNKNLKIKIFFVFDRSQDEKTIYYYKRGREYYFSKNKIFRQENSKFLFTLPTGEVYGTPQATINLNEKKPFLNHKTRKKEFQRLVNREEALWEIDFFFFLKSLFNNKIRRIYFDTNKNKIYYPDLENFPDEFSGILMEIALEKSFVAIAYIDSVPRWKNRLPKDFVFQEYFFESQKEMAKNTEDPIEEYFFDRKTLLEKINKTFFKFKIFTSDLNDKKESLNFRKAIFLCRDVMFNFLYRGIDEDIYDILKKAVVPLIIEDLLASRKNSMEKLNLLYSLRHYYKNKKGDEAVSLYQQTLKYVKEGGDWDFASDQEYYFAVGQLAYYILQQSAASGKASPFTKTLFLLVCQTYVTESAKKRSSVSLGDFHPKGRIGNALYPLL